MIKKIPKLLILLFLGSGLGITFAEEKAIESLINPNFFSDVDSSDVEILYLAAFDIIKGYPDKTAKNDQIINRAEATTLYARLFELDAVYDPNCTFHDIDPNSWYAGYVSAMCNKGLINGYPDGTFKAHNPINRAEAIKILLLGLGVDLYTDFSHLPNNIYSDMWYAQYADYAIKRNISPIIDTEFNGDKLYTRGDLFLNIYRIKRLMELNEEIYYRKLDPIVIDENTSQIEDTITPLTIGTPDLTIKDISAGGQGFSSIFIDVNICNEGERAEFKLIELKLNEYYKTFENLTLNAEECFTTGYYGRISDRIELTDILNNWGETISFSAEIDSDKQIIELNEDNNKLDKIITIPLCGNNVCEVGENHGVCPFDCEVPCQSEFCNEKITVYCGCSEREYLLRECTFNEPCAENDCKDQEVLFDEILTTQTEVYDCLADYFDYEPPRVPYIVYAQKTPVCNIPGGCPRPNGSRYTTTHYIINPLTPGYVPHGELYVTQPDQLIVDEHEMTHHFLNNMLHSIPSWFNEGIAIQTDVRLNCDVKAHPFTSGMGYEKTLESGKAELETNPYWGVWLNEDGSITFSEKFYTDLKEEKISIDPEITPKMYTTSGTRDAHFIGGLFMIGLKLDYNCTEECVRDIVLKLYEFEKNRCPGPECGIHSALGSREGEEGINATIIKEKTNEVVGQDTYPLFKLLGLQ